MEVPSFRVSVASDLINPPFAYPCESVFFRDFTRCALSTNFYKHCLSLRTPCPLPGPGAYMEFFVFLLTALRQNYTTVEIGSAVKVSSLESGAIDITPTAIGVTVERAARIAFTTRPFPAGRFCYILRTDSLFQFKKPINLISLFRPFSSAFWFCFLGTFVAFALIFFAASTRLALRNVAQALWKAFVEFSGSAFSSGEEHRSITITACSFLFLTFAFVIQQIYTNLLTTSLIQTSLPEALFTTSEELAELILNQGYQLADFANSGKTFNAVLNGSTLIGHRKLLHALEKRPPKLFTEQHEAQLALMADSKLIFIGSLGAGGTYSALTHGRRSCSLLSLQEDTSLEETWYAFGVNPRRKALAWKLSELISVHEPIAKAIAHKYNMVGKCVTMKQDLEQVVMMELTLTDAIGLFALWAFSMIACLATFVVERAWKRGTRANRFYPYIEQSSLSLARW